MNTPDPDYDFSQTPFDLNEPPPSIPLEQYDMSGPAINPDDQDLLDQFAAENAIPVSPENTIGEIPEHVLKETELGLQAEEANLELTDFSKFLNKKYEELNEKAKARNPNAPPLGHDSVFEKNIQSQWFVEYNQEKVKNGEKEKILLCKPNGFFYSDKDTVESALKDYGFDQEAVSQLAPHLQFNFIGNTEIRGNKAKGTQRGQFKTFVMNLKDPSSADSQEAMAAIVAQKTQFVQQHLDKNYDLEKAKNKILSRVDDLVTSETNKSGVKPFIGVGPALFLNSSAVYEKLAEIPEIKDKFKIEPLDVNGNKITYTGFSEGLNSYFNSDLKLHKVTTKNSDLLSQQELEGLISEHLKDEKEPLLIAPEHNDNRIIEKQHQKHEEKLKAEGQPESLHNDTPKLDSKEAEAKDIEAEKTTSNPNEQALKEDAAFYKGKAKDSKAENDDLNDEEAADKQKRKRMRGNEEGDGKTSLGEVAVKAAQKIAEAALKALIRLAQLIVMMLIALLQAIFSAGKHVMSHLTNKPYISGPNMLTKFAQTNFGDNLFERKNNGKASEKEQTNDIKNALEELESKEVKPEIKPLDLEAPENGVNKQLAALGLASTFDPLKDASSKLDSLDTDKQNDLSEKALEKIALMTDEQKSDYLKTLDIPAAHKFDEGLESKLTPTLMYHDQHGVLLGKGDEVRLEDGLSGGILSAYDVGGKLHYAVVSESDDKNYKIDYLSADTLTLTGHNKISFDNEQNLIKQADDAVLEKYKDEHEGKIEKIEILNHQDPQPTAINIKELASIVPLVSHETLDTLKPIDYLKAYEDSTYKTLNEDKLSTYQLHNDKTDSLIKEPNHGQKHPLFGKILDVNDAVEATLPRSGMLVEGAITGAYVHNNQLYYNLKTDKSTYNLPASDVTLNKVNGGNLSDQNIRDILQSQHKNTLISDAHKIGATILPLFHKDPHLEPSHVADFRKSIESKNNLGFDALANVGVKPLLRDDSNSIVGSGQIYAVSDKELGTRHFVSLGQVVDPDTNQTRSLGLEIKKSILASGGFAAIQGGEATIKEIDIDSPSVALDSKATPKHLESIINNARQMYESGSNKTKATLLATFIKEAESKLDLNNNVEQLFTNKVLAASLLSENANKVFNPESGNILGVDANLANTSINDKPILDALNTPASQKEISNLENASLHKPKQLLPNEIIFNAASNINMGFDDLNAFVNQQKSDVKVNLKLNNLESNFAPLDSKMLAESVAQINVVENNGHDQALDKVVDQIVNHKSQIVDEVMKLKSSLPESVLMRVALSYVTGERLCSNQEGGIDLLTGRENLLQEHSKIKQEIVDLIPAITPYIQGFDSEGRINNISDIKVSDFNGLKSLLQDDRDTNVRLENLTNKEATFNSKFDNHLDKIETRFEKINSKLNLNEFDTNNLETLNSVAKEFIYTIKSDYENIHSTNNLVTLLNEVKKSEPDTDYGDIAKKVVSNNAEFSTKLDNRLTSITSSFKPKFQEQSANLIEENTLKNKNDSLGL